MKKIILKILIITASAFVIYILITSYFIYPVTTAGMSMYPTISPKEIKITNRWKIVSNKRNIQRGDIIVFDEPSKLYISKEEFDITNVMAKYDNKFNFEINTFKKRYMKRVIGLPGEHIKIENGKVYINEKELDEEHLESEYKYTDTESYEGKYMYIDIVIPEDAVYVMGDNRKKSNDSRSFGCIPFDKIYSILE